MQHQFSEIVLLYVMYFSNLIIIWYQILHHRKTKKRKGSKHDVDLAIKGIQLKFIKFNSPLSKTCRVQCIFTLLHFLYNWTLLFLKGLAIFTKI